MGRQVVQFTVTGKVSRHNSDEDKEDDADWLRLCERLEMVAREHSYERIISDVYYTTS